MINDFATDEFISKNVRVRPTSSKGAGGREESEFGNKAGVGSGEDDDDRKFNTDMLHDLKTWRNDQKERKKKEEEYAILEAEKAEKKRKQKQ